MNVFPNIQNLGIVVQGWYPLGGRGHTAELLNDPVISSIAQAHGGLVLSKKKRSRPLACCAVNL